MRKTNLSLLVYYSSFLSLFLYPAPSINAQRIYTIAGGTGNGCKLSSGVVGFPVYMTFDKNNNIYATCIDNSIGAISIRKYDFQNDIVTSVAGNDTYSAYAGDGNPATQVSLSSDYNAPSTIAFDKNENLFITLRWQNSIRRVDRKGIITTIAGNGIAGFSGDGGLAKGAQLNNPTDIAFDREGNLYIADVLNRRIRKINKKGIISTFAGNGSKEYNGDSIAAKQAGMSPQWITTDDQGNLFVYDANNKRIRKIDTSGIIYNIAGNGYGTSSYPPDTSIAKHTPINYINNILIDNKHNLYFVESFNVYKVSPRGLMTRFAGGGTEAVFTDNIPATSARFSEPIDLALDKGGNIYVTAGYYITKVDSENILHNVLGLNDTNTGSPVKEAPEVGNIAINPYADSLYFFQKNILYTADRRKGILNLKAGGGTYENNSDSGLAVNAFFQYISNVCFDRNGNTYVCDRYANNIRKIDQYGIIHTIAGTGKKGFSGDGRLAINARFNEPTGVATDSAGNLYIADYGNSRIRKVDAATQIISTIAGDGFERFYGDGGPAITASLYYPYDLAFDRDNNLYIADSRNRRIRKIDKKGIITTVAGNGTLNFTGTGLATQKSIGRPDDIAFDKQGNLYICDGRNSHIFKVDANSRLTLYAGIDSGSVADGVLPVRANIGYPQRIALDAAENFYISDGYHVKEIYTECNNVHAADRHTIVHRYVNKSEILNDGCNLVCRVAPTFNAVNGLNSLVSSEVSIADSVIQTGNNFLVQRHYQLWSVVRPLTAKTVITLYFTQAELNNYNREVSSAFTLLPKNKKDSANIRHLRIVQYQDTLTDQNQLPPFTASTTETLNPNDENIQWNDSLNCWQVTMEVAGLGNFYLTSISLPKTIIVTKAVNSVLDNAISVYPNPVKDMIVVQIPNVLISTYIQIVAQDGKVVFSKKLNSNINHVSVSNLAAGMYLLRFKDGSIVKVVKE